MEKSKNFPVLREEKVSRKNPPIIDASRWMVIPDRDQEKWFLKLSLLGRGGFSEVYKVQSMEDNEVYALKAVSYTHEGEGLLANEIKILQKLKGLPWIVELKDFFSGQGISDVLHPARAGNIGSVPSDQGHSKGGGSQFSSDQL
jgi:serine/threonine protein kinase